ncbi:MAG TPA: energy-coupling factor transporter transmembrane protein EcfT, partial [Candidatus Avacidaminococcus intestinavium]|nr:energy-coupling factor transporter transmembrane protein EcfT [Candidatus Avacidaminococcus intestinavium]
MSMRQLWEGSDAAEWAREIDGRTKLLLLFAFSILVITIDNPRTLFFIFSISLLLHLLVKTSIYKWQVMAILLLLGLWGSMFSQALFFSQTPRTPLFILLAPGTGFLGQLTGGITIYREGIVYGAIQGLRSATMLSMGLLVCWVSDPR